MQLFKLNDYSYRESCKPYLTFQTIKSIIRKNKSTVSVSGNLNYKEKINNIYMCTDLNIEYNELFNIEEIETNNLLDLYETINNQEMKLKLLLGLNCNSLQSESEINNDKNKISQIDREQQLKEENTIEFINYDFINRYFEFEELKLRSIELETYENYTLRYLPNIFTYNNYYINSDNKSGFAFIIDKKILILIPAYLIFQYFESHTIIDINFNILNKKKLINEEIYLNIQTFKNFKFYKLLHYQKYNILSDILEGIFANDLIIYIAFYYLNIFIKLTQRLNDQIENGKRLFIELLQRQTTYLKYIKYKNKYLKYK
jgi:hypothetical protein